MVIDLRRLLGGGRGRDVEVHGVRAGDSAGSLVNVRWTSADGDELPGEKRSYAGGRVLRWVGEAQKEIPLEQRVQGVVARRGWLRDGDVAIWVEHGRAQRVIVRGTALAALGIGAREQIEHHLGVAEGRVRRQKQVAFLYPTRGLEVVWDDAGHLDHVALGDVVSVEPRRGAPALLGELVARWKALEALRWREPPPGALQVRHRRIAALARALELGTVEDVVLGRSVARRPDDHVSLLAEIAARAPVTTRQFVPAEMVFGHLLHYRVASEGVLGAARGWLECGDAALLGMIHTQLAIAAVLSKELAPIDDWLARFLDPRGRAFSERELVEKWGWPDVDPSMLDLEEELGPD